MTQIERSNSKSRDNENFNIFDMIFKVACSSKKIDIILNNHFTMKSIL